RRRDRWSSTPNSSSADRPDRAASRRTALAIDCAAAGFALSTPERQARLLAVGARQQSGGARMTGDDCMTETVRWTSDQVRRISLGPGHVAPLIGDGDVCRV